MSELLSALKVAGIVLGLWSLASALAAFPLATLFRIRSRANDELARDGRQRDWSGAIDDAAIGQGDVAR